MTALEGHPTGCHHDAGQVKSGVLRPPDGISAAILPIVCLLVLSYRPVG